jgi:hypothetical protein
LTVEGQEDVVGGNSITSHKPIELRLNHIETRESIQDFAVLAIRFGIPIAVGSDCGMRSQLVRGSEQDIERFVVL